MKVIIIGTGPAGTLTAIELRKLSKECEIAIIGKTQNTMFSPCSLPYLIGGELKAPEEAVVMKEQDYKALNIQLMLSTEVKSIDTENKTLTASRQGKELKLSYDKLVLATGSTPAIPPIPGLDTLPRTCLKTIQDAEKILLYAKPGEEIAVIGAGLIGTEVAAELRKKGAEVHLIEAKDRILPTIFDANMARHASAHLKEKGIHIHESTLAKKIENKKLILEDKENKETHINPSLIILAVGVSPSTSLAESSGIQASRFGIKVDEYLETSAKDVYACGDCTESTHLLLNKPFSPFTATAAEKQARAVASTLAGKKKELTGIINPVISKAGDMHIGSAGLLREQAEDSVEAVFTSTTKSGHFPGAKPIHVKIIASQDSTIIGAQVAGMEETAPRLNLLAFAIQSRVKLSQLAEAEFAYNPALSPLKEPISIAARTALAKLERLKR